MAEFNKKTVYVLDSYGLIFRCYFAFISRPLTNGKGENVSALFGFFRNFHFILKHYEPGCIVAAMDSKTKTFRHEKYPAYKATRNKTPEDLHAQIPWIEEVLKALEIPVLQCDGYEADDIIATVAKKCRETGRTCRILSGDKDLMQLVDDSTQILKPESGAATWKVTDADGVFAEWGVRPDQLKDLLSLYGDSVDNIPGVSGIGVKTAGKLLNQYENLDGIYAHLDEIKGSVHQKLLDGKQSAIDSEWLVRLCDSVPCEEIDAALNKENYEFDYKAASELLFSYGVPSVAKQYGELTSGEKGVIGKTAEGQNEKKDSGKDKSELSAESAGDGTDGMEMALTVVKNQGKYSAVLKADELEKFVNAVLQSTEKTVAYDCETDSLNTLEANMAGFSLCCKGGEAVYVPLNQGEMDLFSETDYMSGKEAFPILKKLFENPDVRVVLHNAKFDLKVLVKNAGISLDDIKCKIADTMIAAWIINPERTGRNGYSLESLGETILGLRGIEYDEVVEKGQVFADVPLEKAVPYAAEDADFTFQLWEKFNADEKMTDSALFNMEMEILPLLAKMEIQGIHLDRQNLLDYDRELTLGIAQAEQNIYKEVGHEFNIASPKQLQTVLFEERGLKPGKKTKTGYSTDTTVLEELSLYDAVPKMILEYRELAKLQSTYVETLPELADKNGRIHPDFIQTGTATGRLSCRDPNLQNIPVRSEAGRRIRSAFTAPEGKVLISADYAQIELVVLAHLSGDENMCRAFNEGTDVHKATAAMIYGVTPENVTPEMRRTAKTINFGVIYGMSAFRLARDLGISRTQAALFIDNYFKLYSSVNNFINDTVRSAEEKGYVETIFGRRRPIMNINSRNKVEKAAAERVAVNTPVQGSAADIVKKAMLEVSRELKALKSPAKLLLQVHDELILECPDDETEIQKTISLIKNKMENAVKLKVPLRVSVEYGKNWGEFH